CRSCPNAASSLSSSGLFNSSLAAQRLCQIGQAEIHAIVYPGMVVGELFIAVGDALGFEGAVDAAGAIENVVLILGAAFEMEGLELADGVKVLLDHQRRVPFEPVVPALGDELASVSGDGEAEAEIGLGIGVGIKARRLGEDH